jgi:hypothetical protein
LKEVMSNMNRTFADWRTQLLLYLMSSCIPDTNTNGFEVKAVGYNLLNGLSVPGQKFRLDPMLVSGVLLE